ncbi:myb-like protein P isoform X1 [Stomoxys calcitrans]|uniref:myb-like protein P isoform X1 n=1 Tax=Stomoxys calcitrans TaxID=35570 RepID=UPI0027E330C8|nr:myb-like protein P isoform X1 [Stomoxys calcitrans]
MATTIGPAIKSPPQPAITSNRPHQSQASPTSANKRGHIRSASLENANALMSKNTLGLPMVQPGHSGTLKSRNEQKRMRNKFGSHSNLDDFVQQGRNKFNNIRQIFEITKGNNKSNKNASNASMDDSHEHQLQSLPPMMTTSLTCASSNSSSNLSSISSASMGQQKYSPLLPMTKRSTPSYQQPTARKPPLAPPSMSVATPPLNGCGSGTRNSITDISERLNMNEQLETTASKNRTPQPQPQSQQHIQHHHQQQRQHLQSQQQQQQRMQTHAVLVHNTHMQQQQQHHPQLQQHPQPQRSASDLPQIQSIDENHEQQTTNLLRPIAFKPIPFEPDYTIPSRYCDVVSSAQAATASANSSNMGGSSISGSSNISNGSNHVISTTHAHNMIVGDRYGSTPSLAAVQGSNMRFGSTTDLRHGGGGVGLMGAGAVNAGVGFVNGSGGGGSGGGVGYSSNNYCNSLMARRRGSRSLKINDSMESIRHTPDSDINSQTGTIKSTDSGSGLNVAMSSNSIPMASSSCSSTSSNGINKYCMSSSDQCDMTPSPSDSGISDLEAALKDRDSELSYLRQTMEHNEKVIFKVQKDKESYWENETKRLKLYYEAQQREYMLKIKKMEQMVAMQQFQFKQHKLRHNEQTQKLREQLAELKSEYEMLKSNNISIKNSERNLKDRSAYIEEQFEESQNTIGRLKAQLEESEWKVCEKNGELALLKTQLKEATNELTLKEHAIVHLKHENTNAESQIYQSLQENQKMTQQQLQEEQQKAQSQKETQTELKQLNKIIILKDQVILALTNELAKLRKELSDLAIFHEYGEEPSGKYTRLKQQLDNLTDICNKTRKHTQQRIDNHKSSEEKQDLAEKVIDDSNLEVIMNCLKISPPLDESDSHERELNKLNCELRLAKMSADIQNFVYGSQNLPDVAINIHKSLSKLPNCPLEESTLDTLIEESASYAEEIAKLRKQLDDVRVNFELEKRQWSTEKEKVLQYQKQLQTHYISMYQKLRNLEKSNEV